MKYFSIVIFLFLFTSCTANLAGIGMLAVIGLFALMFILFAIMFYLIAKRKKQGEKSLVKFNNDIHNALNRLDTLQQKINMLNTLLERINNDEKYKKDTEWRDKVLVKVHMYLATIYYRIGDQMQTLNNCSKIIELDGKDAMAYYNRGSIYSNMGMYEKALHDLNQTIDLEPNYASAYNNRGLVHEKMEHYEEALCDYSKAIELEGSSIAYYNKANTYFEMGDYNAALGNYNLALEKLETGNQPELKEEIEACIKVVEDKLSEL